MTRESEVVAGRRNKKRKRAADGEGEGEGVLSNANVCNEEIQAEWIQKVDEEDHKRHNIIAQQFDANSKKARVQRIED